MKPSTPVLVLLAAASAPLAFSAPISLSVRAPRRLIAQAHDASGAGAALHGGAAKSAAPAKLAEVSFAPGVKDKNVGSFFRSFAEALKTHDGKPLLPRLAAGYTIEGLPPEWEIRESFVKAIGMIAGPDEIVVTAIKQDKDLKVVTTEFRFATRVASKVFTFDAQDKLLNTDFIAMKRPAAPASIAPKSEAKK
jgi:hypothetical protein